MNTSRVAKRNRSAKPPMISAGVITAKVIWNSANTGSGIVPLTLSTVTPAKNSLSSPPMKALPSEKVRL